MKSNIAYFDSNGVALSPAFLGEVPARVVQAKPLNTWVDVFGKVATSAVGIAQQREDRRLQETYLKAGLTPPPPPSAGGGADAAAPGGSTPWAMFALMGGALLLAMR